MAGIFRLHSKIHGTSHHTVSGTSEPNSGLDPIASERFPFLGTFYNLLTNNDNSFSILTNSIEWWSAFSTVSSVSSRWEPTLSLYNTENTLSANWQKGYSDYISLNAVSANNNSVFSTINANSASWSSPYILFTNRVHDKEKALVFTGADLPSTGSIDWNLNLQQNAFIQLSNTNIAINNPTNAKKGGYYILVIKNSGAMNCVVDFDTQYKINGYEYPDNIVLVPDPFTGPYTRVVIKFVYDGTFMNGDISKYLI